MQTASGVATSEVCESMSRQPGFPKHVCLAQHAACSVHVLVHYSYASPGQQTKSCC